MTKLTKLSALYFLACIICFTNCESANKEIENKEIENNGNEEENLKDKKILGISIPSPIQTAMYIKEAGAEFNDDNLNSTDNAQNYSTDFYKAFNLGVYGTDLGYCAIYENNDLCIQYMKTVREMADDIGLENAFNEDLLERFGNNMGNKDSMTVLIAEAYKDTDLYLKENDKDDVAALILAGGWIEAIYIACKAVKEDNNQMIANRIAEQKSALESFIYIFGQKTSDDYEDLFNEFNKLYDIFDQIEYDYKFIESATPEPKTKTTLIRSKREIIKTDELLESITAKLIEIRNEYTQ